MIIALENGKKIVLADVVKEPKAEAIKWLRQYKESKEKARDGPGRGNP